MEVSKIKPIRVSVIESDAVNLMAFQCKVKNAKGFQLMSADTEGRKGILSVKKERPDVVLLDFLLCDISGLEVALRIKTRAIKIKILMVSTYTSLEFFQRMASSKNVDAVALKGSCFFDNYFPAILKAVYEGERYYEPSLTHLWLKSTQAPALQSLTNREFEVFLQVHSGKRSKEIARDLLIEEMSIRKLRSTINKKLKKTNIHELRRELWINFRGR